MKANEFVKKFGWDRAKREVALIGTIAMMCGDNDFNNDLKRLVESHELVAIHGFEKSKEIVANAPSDDHFYSWTLGSSGVRDKTVNIGELRKAIADVESCMEVSSESN
ncbi:hypothetical protein [Acinetobacter indicus]|uniref:hypothetical protein n=1 Tax=Acinetobacter indicus TaxID=756892 RepID=UPI0032B5E031